MTVGSERARRPLRLDADRIARTLDDIEAIGNRYAGTEGEARCRDYLLERFAELGLEAPHVEEFHYLAYAPIGFRCRVLHPDLGDLPCRPLQYTANARVEGEAVYVGAGEDDDLRRLEEFGIDLDGKVAVVHSIHPAQVTRRLDDRSIAIAGLVVVSEAHDGLIGNFTATLYPPPLEPPWAGRPLPYPGVTVEAAAGRRLISTMSVAGETVIEIEHEADYRERATANVVGALDGPRDGRVVVGAHYDTQIEGPCVWDNGGGVAGLLEVVRALACGPAGRPVTVVGFAAEEIGIWGATNFVEEHRSEMDGTVGMVNFDGGGSRYPTKRTLFVNRGMREFALETARLNGRVPEVVVDAQEFEGADEAPFSDAGVPACAIHEYPPIHPYYHTAGDVRALVDPAQVCETAGISGLIVQRLTLEDPPHLPRTLSASIGRR